MFVENMDKWVTHHNYAKNEEYHPRLFESQPFQQFCRKVMPHGRVPSD